MKTKYFKSVLLGTTLPVFAFAQNNTFTISGHINPAHNGKALSISYLKGGKNLQDSTFVTGGTFILKGTIDTPCLTYIRIGNKRSANVTDFYLAAGTTSIVTRDSLKFAKIGGNEIATDYFRLMEPIRPLQKQKSNFTLQYHAIPADQKKGIAATALTGKIADVNRQINDEIYTFIADNPSSYISLEALENLSGAIIDYAVVHPKFCRLSDKIKNTAKGKAFAEKIAKAKNVAIGARAIHFESITATGKRLKLKDVLNTGKYTLLDFWASWCGPCRKENPVLVKAYQTYHKKGLNILGISLDDDAGKWKAAIEKDGLPWYQVSGLKGWKEPVALLYGITALPQNVLLDAHGIVVARNLHGDALLKKLAGILK